MWPKMLPQISMRCVDVAQQQHGSSAVRIGKSSPYGQKQFDQTNYQGFNMVQLPPSSMLLQVGRFFFYPFLFSTWPNLKRQRRS